MKPCVLAYVPPPKVGHHPRVFLDNLEKFPPEFPALFYSDHPWPGCVTVPNPECVKNSANKFAVNNCVFLLGLQLVLRQGFTHLIYIEADSRVGVAGWDRIMMDDFCSGGVAGPLFGGSLVCYNPFNGGPQAAAHFERLVAKFNVRRNFPVAGRVAFDGTGCAAPHFVKAFGWKGAADGTGSCVFPNGSLSIWDVNFLRDILGKIPIVESAASMRPWDMELGLRIWNLMQHSAYNFAAQLTTSYSSYGNVISTEDERMEMLRSGRVVAVHQVKSEATI